MTVHRIGDLHNSPQEPSDEDAPLPTRRFDWERFIRLSPLPTLTKCVALTMATYGDLHGRNIHPGDDNLAADCGITTRAVRTHRNRLEELGFFIRTADAKPGPRGRAAEFVLSVPRNFNDLEGARGPDGGPAPRLPN